MKLDFGEKEILQNRTVVSDTLRFTSSSGSISCFDPDRGRIYCAYLASEVNYGESYDFVMLAEIPIAQPERTRNYTVAARGGVQDGVTLGRLIDCNCVCLEDESRPYEAATHFGTVSTLYRRVVRVFFESGGRDYYYRDFDVQSGTLSPLYRCRALVGGCERPLTDGVLTDYLSARGRDWTFERNESVILTTKLFRQKDGWFYGFFTAPRCCPVCFRTKDAAVFEPLGFIDKPGQYETQCAMAGGRLHALIRGAEGDNYYISDDFGLTFKAAGRLEHSGTRPQMIEYRDRVLIGWSETGIRPNLARDGRNNLRLSVGEGPNPAGYETVFSMRDELGVVYYDIVNYKDTLYMIWSSGELYIDKNPQAKDLLFFAKLGRLREDRP